MKIVDIQNVITKLLHSNFPTYKIVLAQQCDVVKPTFFVSVRKINTDNYRTCKEKLVNVTITYVNKETDHIENNEVNDKLDEIFGLTLKVNDYYFTIDNLNFSEPDALICSFTVKFNEHIEDTNKYEKMQELAYRS